MEGRVALGRKGDGRIPGPVLAAETGVKTDGTGGCCCTGAEGWYWL